MSAQEKLTPAEIELLDELLGRIGRLPNMQREAFSLFWKHRLMPMNPQELVILERIPNDVYSEGFPRVLLTYRPPSDPYYPDCWHHPGGYLGSNESVEKDAIQRIAKREIKVGVKNIEKVSIVNWPKLERDHEFSGLYICEPEGTPELIPGRSEWFAFFKLPEKLLYHHNLMHNKVAAHLMFRSVLYKLSPVCFENFKGLRSILESDAKK